jgi:hypothetical protein
MRRPPILLVAALAVGAVTLAACGAYGDGVNADAERSLAASITTVLDDEAPLVDLRSVDCDGAEPRLTCLVSLGVGNTVVQVRFAVEIGADRCWVADARRTVVLGAGTQTNPLPELTAASDLKGCLR